VCDFDEVDTVNTSSQFYSMNQLGKPKVEMLKENIKKMADEDIEIINGKYEK
jgi:tRNA A37 threonylcarbamoyladenosine dehydratase